MHSRNTSNRSVNMLQQRFYRRESLGGDRALLTGPAKKLHGAVGSPGAACSRSPPPRSPPRTPPLTPPQPFARPLLHPPAPPRSPPAAPPYPPNLPPFSPPSVPPASLLLFSSTLLLSLPLTPPHPAPSYFFSILCWLMHASFQLCFFIEETVSFHGFWSFLRNCLYLCVRI